MLIENQFFYIIIQRLYTNTEVRCFTKMLLEAPYCRTYSKVLEIPPSLWTAPSHLISAFGLPSFQPPYLQCVGCEGMALVPHCLDIWHV